MPPETPLEALFALGERMHAALAAEDLALFFDLVAERGTLLEELKTSARPAGDTPDRKRLAAVLVAQQEALAEAAAERERRLGEALFGLERLKNAHQHYQQQPPPRSGSILSENLSV